MSINPKVSRNLNQVILLFFSNLVVLASISGDLSCGQPQNGINFYFKLYSTLKFMFNGPHGHRQAQGSCMDRHIDRQMQATAISGGLVNIKMSSYQYRKSYSGDETIIGPSYLHNGNSFTGKTTSLYWIKAQKAKTGPGKNLKWFLYRKIKKTFFDDIIITKMKFDVFWLKQFTPFQLNVIYQCIF